ncbi:hypothetical protein, partial [Methylobacter sp.]|uniref:hypothetical protein n=1 Tax=Methylobacter sp. TaxID=2051955 RepID=UPI0012294DEA
MVGNYRFRLLDIAQATPLTPGTVVSGQLSPANETDLYQFNATAGERFYFNYISISATNYWPYWRLLDPNGQLVFGPGSFGSDKEPLTLTQTGVYTLLIEGNVSNTGTANNYSFAVQKVTDEQFPLTVGVTVNGSIAHAGQRDFYNFNLSEAKQLYFDALTGTHTNWTLVGSRGTVVFERPLGSTDSGRFTGASAIYDLDAGDYTLIIDGYYDLVGNYSFRLLDIAQATPLTPGTTVSGQLSPVNETDLYQFAVTAGERFYFDYQSFSGNWSYRPYWRLVDPYGQLVFGPDTLEIEKGPLTLMQTGAYTLLIEGRITNPEISTNYSFVVQKITDEQYPLTVGNTVNGSIAHAGQRDFYNFSLSEAKQLYFDSLTNNSSFNWTLIGPQGTVVSAMDFTKSDSNYPNGSTIYDLVAGDYTLTIDGNADMVGDYRFRLLDIAQATVLTPGTTVSGQLTPANETDLYQFAVTAGERFYFDYKTYSGGYSPYWRLLDPYGQLVFGPAGFGADNEPLPLSQTGAYTLLIEGQVGDAGATSSYSFNVQKVTDEQLSLTLGDTVNGSIAHAGQRDFYSFSLSEAKQLYFDSLTYNNSVNWTLVGPRGTVVSGRNFDSTDSGSFTGASAIYDLVAGDYTLIIDGNADMVGNYSFRLLDIAQATPVTPGTVVSGQLSPANETDLYQFAVTAGDQYLFDSQSLSNGAYWRLLD